MIKKFFVSNRFIYACFVCAGALVILGFLSAYIPLRKISQPIVIHFTSAEREPIDMIGDQWDLVKIACIGLVMAGINFLITRELMARDVFFSRFFSVATLFFGVLIFYLFFAILGAN